MIVGIDEAGRGPLAGAVVACALAFKKQPPFPVSDSKLLSASKRQEIFTWLSANALFAIESASVEEIDRYNILEATFLAFDRAIVKLLKRYPRLAKGNFIIDGTFFKTKRNIKYQCLKQADQKIKEVSCASIMAKVSRDHFMGILSFLYPEWNFSRHKGYPTKEHFSLLKRYRLTPFHRRSFSPCKGI